MGFQCCILTILHQKMLLKINVNFFKYESISCEKFTVVYYVYGHWIKIIIVMKNI